MIPSLRRLSLRGLSTGTPLVDRIKNPNTIKVLILCHPQPFSEGHWQKEVIQEKTEALFRDRLASEEQTIDYFTLDPRVTNHGQRADFFHEGAQTLFQETNFSRVERFDMVWAPDCGGEWWDMWNLEGDAQGAEFVRLVRTMSMSVLPGGFLMLGKLPFSVEKGVDLLKDQGFLKVESAPIRDPFDRDNAPGLVYILVQKQHRHKD